MVEKLENKALSKSEEIKKFERELIKNTIAKDCNELEFKFFLSVCRNTGLNPLLRQIYPVKYQGRMVIQVGIDGFRLQAERSGKYIGQLGPFWCGDDGVWKDVWVSDQSPVAAKVGILRKDFVTPDEQHIEPIWGIAKFKSFAKYFNGKLGDMWEKSGDNQLAKCAESQAIRKAFPQETAGLSIPEEQLSHEIMDKLAAENAADAKVPGKPPVQQPKAKDIPADVETSGDSDFSKQIFGMISEMGWAPADEKRKKANDMIAASGVSAALDFVQAEYEVWVNQPKKATTPAHGKFL
jgi:phage recombination protein Bet